MTWASSGPNDLVLHGRADPQLGPPRLVGHARAVAGVRVVLGHQDVVQRGRDARVALDDRHLLVREELGLDDEQRVRAGVLGHADLVGDRRHRALRERHEPLRRHRHPLAVGGDPVDVAGQRARAHVERAAVRAHLAVAHVERLVVDEHPDQLAVGDVDQRLALVREPEPALGVRQRAGLEERVEVGARHRVRLPLVEVAAHPDVAVGQREQRLGLGQRVEVDVRFVDHPGVDAERVRDHGVSSSTPDARGPRPTALQEPSSISCSGARERSRRV